jgi:alkanesulfonate monooxygenase SsuD/methylene tetrahydromethanopterin reductase-like flavin-dependent oxidoreductase (luciferase family)
MKARVTDSMGHPASPIAKGKETMPKLGICISPFMGLSLARLAEFAREAEDAGIEGVFIPEGKNDGLMCCYAVAKATKRATVATWIVNIFLREPALCSWAARQVADEAPGRFILGLGVSHRPLLENLGINVQNARERLRHYTHELRRLLEDLGTSRAVAGGVPIYFAALALETVRLGTEIADGLMLDICTVDRLQTAATTAHSKMNRRGRLPAQFTITTGVPLFLHPDRDRALAAAQRTLARYASLPAYNRMFARSGFAAEMAKLLAVRDSAEEASAMIRPAMVESVALIGPPTEWPDRLEALAQAGADWVIVRPFAVEGDYESSLHEAISALAQVNQLPATATPR